MFETAGERLVEGEENMKKRYLVTGGKLLDHGHRYIDIDCDKCHTDLFMENFD